MTAKTVIPSTEAAIWPRIVNPDADALAREVAVTILGRDFKAADRARMEGLRERASVRTLAAL